MTSALLLAAATPPSLASHGYDESPIQPGAHVYGIGRCTMSFLFLDDADAWYVGTAAHCVEPGQRVQAPFVGGRFTAEVGTVVYHAYVPPESLGGIDLAPGAYAEPAKDFALVRIDEDRYDLVDPAVRFFGGPTAVAEDARPGTPIVHHGRGVAFDPTLPSRNRGGVLLRVYDGDSISNERHLDGWFLAQDLVVHGDSGGPVLTLDGRALGVIGRNGATALEPGNHIGPTIEKVLADLRAAGFHLRLATAPATAAADAALGLAEHCTERPAGREGCVKLGPT